MTPAEKGKITRERNKLAREKEARRQEWRAKKALRESLEAEYGHRYENAFPERTECVYCGLPATGLDHVPPLSKAHRFSDATRFHLFPACRICNSSLRGWPSLCLVNRAKTLLSNYEHAFYCFNRQPQERYLGFPRSDYEARHTGITNRLASGQLAQECNCPADYRDRNENHAIMA